MILNVASETVECMGVSDTLKFGSVTFSSYVYVCTCQAYARKIESESILSSSTTPSTSSISSLSFDISGLKGEESKPKLGGNQVSDPLDRIREIIEKGGSGFRGGLSSSAYWLCPWDYWTAKTLTAASSTKSRSINRSSIGRRKGCFEPYICLFTGKRFNNWFSGSRCGRCISPSWG